MSPALNPLKTQFASPLQSPSLHSLHSSRTLHLHLTIRIQCNQGNAKQKQNPKKKIVLFGAAPPVLDESDRRTGDGGDTPSSSSSSPPVLRFAKRVSKRALALLSNLPLAIGEMATIGALMALATFIEQGESLEYYSSKFPEDKPILGIFTWKWIVYPGFDHMWTSPVFLGLLVLLASSLMACSYTNQIPLVKTAKRYLMHC